MTLRGIYAEFPKDENAIPALFFSALKGRKVKIILETNSPVPIIRTAANKKIGLLLIAAVSEEEIFIKRYMGREIRTTNVLRVVKNLSSQLPNRLKKNPIAISANNCSTV